MIMRFHCSYCGQDWERYTHDDLSGIHVNRCPHCSAGETSDEAFEKAPEDHNKINEIDESHRERIQWQRD